MSELVKRFLKTFGLGLTLTPSNVRIYRRVLLQTIKYRKFHLPGFTNWGLKFGISERIKIFSDPWLTFTPPHFRISERNFKKCLDFRGCKCPDIWKDFSSHLHLDNWIPAIRGTTTAKTLHLHRRAWNAGENHGRKSTGWRPQKCNVALYFEILTKRSGKRRNFNRLVKVFFLPSSYN